MSSIDNYTWPKEKERELNLLAVSVFGKPDGKAFLDYLKAITINAVAGPGVTDEQLRHLEGQRFAVHIIERRIQAGHSLMESLNNDRDTEQPEPSSVHERARERNARKQSGPVGPEPD